MNRLLAWEIEDTVKEIFKARVKSGAEIQDLKLESESKTEEERMTIKSLLEGGYIDLTLSPGVYIISENYYNYLKKNS